MSSPAPGYRERTQMAKCSFAPIDTLRLCGLRPSLPGNLERKRRHHSYGYACDDLVQPDLARTHPHKFVGNELEQPTGWPEGRKAGGLESLRTLVQFPG